MNAVTNVPLRQAQSAAPKLATYDARDLTHDGAQACIVLDHQTYYLRITRVGKLILTK